MGDFDWFGGLLELHFESPITYKWKILIGLVVCYSFTPSTGAHTNGTNTLGRDRKWCEGRLKPCLLQPVEAAYKQLGGEMKNILEKPSSEHPYWDSNPDLLVIGCLVYCDSDALDHAATGACSNPPKHASKPNEEDSATTSAVCTHHISYYTITRSAEIIVVPEPGLTGLKVLCSCALTQVGSIGNGENKMS
uniref:Uncharacterized protein n=1 Tax=Timema cristinae TaxID=61476 RepID=A0A7R9DBH6_TIMCR|nr:unnamed protein product [Timema cristinae]